jgi:large repetitive protein
MSMHRSTVGVLAALCASLGTLAVTATAQAAGPPADPTITSIAVSGSGSDLTTDGNNSFYTNDPINPGSGMTTDAFVVTVAGDPSASEIDLYDGSGWLSQTPVDGVATFTIPSLAPTTSPGSFDFLSAEQTVGGQTSDTTSDYVFVGSIPSVDIGWVDNTVPAGGTIGVADAIPGDDVQLFLDGSQQPDAAAASDGNADVTAPGLTAAYHTAYAQTVDAQGNPSATSPTVGFYVAPDAPTVQTPVQHPGDAPFSNQNEPSVTVSGVLAGATVDLYLIDPNTGLPGASLDTVTSLHGGSATVTPTTPVPDGQDAFYVTQTVSEGTGVNQQLVTSDLNPSAQNNMADVHVDTTAPSLMTSFTGSVTNNNEPGFEYSLAGVYSSVAKVRLIDANTNQTLGEGTAINSGEWMPTSPLPDGQYSVYAESIDDAGNVGTAHSAPVTFTIDTVPPPAPTVTAPADGSTITTGAPTISTSGNEAGATICLYVDGDSSDVVLPCQTAAGNGTASFTLAAALGDGQHALTLTAEDAAGNDSETDTTFTVNTAAATPTPPVTTPAPPVTTPAPPVTTRSAPPTASSPPVAVAIAAATSTAGVVELDAGKSTSPAGTTITSYAWYVGTKLVGHTKVVRYRLSAAAASQTVTLRVTDSAGGTATAQVKLSVHLHQTVVSLSANTLFAFDSARLTSSAQRLLAKLRPVILASRRVTVDGYTAAAGPSSRQKSWATRLSDERATAVATFLFRGHVPPGVQLSVKGMGAARDGAGTTQDRRSTIAYERLVVTIDA